MTFTPWDRYRNERDYEIPWLLAQQITGPVLDVGCHDSTYLADLPGPVDGIDVRGGSNPALRQVFTADIRTWQAPERYPTIVALSTIEHIGLHFDPYGTTADDEDGDLNAIDGMTRALAPGGVMLITVPYNHQPEHRGWYRLYSRQGLDVLLNNLDWTAEYHYNAAWEVGGVALIVARAKS